MPIQIINVKELLSVLNAIIFLTFSILRTKSAEDKFMIISHFPVKTGLTFYANIRDNLREMSSLVFSG